MKISPSERRAYIDLLGKTLARYPLQPYELLLLSKLDHMESALLAEIRHWAIASQSAVELNMDPAIRSLGLDWPAEAETMIGMRRLKNLEYCVASVLERNVPGDLVETGVWRGGACIFMRGYLKAYGDTQRKVWAIDSFQGLPQPDAAQYPSDRDDDLWRFSELAISLQTVKENFERYGLLDEQVAFIQGWFRNTLPEAPIEKLAVLRLDADMYESTMVALRSLYPKVSKGGYVIVDDYGAIPACRQAVDDFRAEYRLSDPILPVDWTGVYWQVL
jgi:hypothetical protein